MEKKRSEADGMVGVKASHVNGWETIARELKKKGLRQKNLAARLGVSQPAITQFKQGTSKFSNAQLAEIVSYLGFSTKITREFYAEIIDARLAWEPLGTPKNQASSR